MAVIYEDDIENIIGENRTVISTHGIAFGENSKALDNYKLKNNYSQPVKPWKFL